MPNSITGDNARALANNNFYWQQVVWGIKHYSPTYYALTGFNAAPLYDEASRHLKIPTMEDTDGFEGALQFNLALPSFDKVPYGAEEVQLANIQYEVTVEEYSWPLTHYSKVAPVSDKQRRQVSGPYVKTDDLYAVTIATYTAGFAKQINKELWGNTNQTDVSLASLPYIIDNATQYGPDRTVDPYKDLQSYVDSSATALTLNQIMVARLKAKRMGGMSEAAIGSTTTMGWIEFLLRTSNTTYVSVDEKWSGFGGEYFRYGNTVFAWDDDAPDGDVFGLSVNGPGAGAEGGIRHWKMVRNTTPVVEDGFHQEVLLKGQPWLLGFNAYLGLYCATPGGQWKLVAKTAPSNF